MTVLLPVTLFSKGYFSLLGCRGGGPSQRKPAIHGSQRDKETEDSGSSEEESAGMLTIFLCVGGPFSELAWIQSRCVHMNGMLLYVSICDPLWQNQPY